MNKEIKKKFDNDFKKVRTLVNAFDPIGLTAGGSPFDEYDFLTNKILSKKYNKATRNELRIVIINEIEKQFGVECINELKNLYKTRFDKNIATLLDGVDSIM